MFKRTLFAGKNYFPTLKFYSSSFKFADLKLEKAKVLHDKPDCDKIKFGTHFSDHMLQVEWNATDGWKAPRIKPVEPFVLHPGCLVFHYATEIFEGLKAFRGVDNVVRMFRADQIVKRMINSAKRAMLPTFDQSEFLNCLKELIHVDKDWVPEKRGHSLYIRPTMIAVDPKIGVAKSNSAILYVLLCPVGAYYSTGFKPVSLLADPSFVRAWPGGTGNLKMGSNYASTIYVQNEALKMGCQHVLWLFGEDHLLSEVGIMNIFVHWISKSGRKEVITPPLNGTILPGVTRLSLLELMREDKSLDVYEREVSMKELINTLEDGRLLEMFGSGTACVVSPVESIHYQGKKYIIPTMEKGAPLTMKMLQSLTDIQYGVTKREGWTITVH